MPFELCQFNWKDELYSMQPFGEGALTLTGTMIDGTGFEGRDTVNCLLRLNRGMQEF